MLEKISLGSSPAEEECAQVGEEGYTERALQEGVLYINLLHKTYADFHGVPVPSGLRLQVQACPHDYGTYHEVFAIFDSEDEAAVLAAFWLDANAPTVWDDESRLKLPALPWPFPNEQEV